MNIKQTIVSIGVALSILTASLVVASPVVQAAKCGDVKTSIISCKDVNDKVVDKSGVWKILILALNIMTAGIGILAVAGIVYGSVLYTTAGDKAEQTKKAIGIITNVVIGIAAYALMYLVLNFLIPGGVFAA